MKLLTVNFHTGDNSSLPLLELDIEFNIRYVGNFIPPDSLVNLGERENSVLPILHVPVGHNYTDLMIYAGSSSPRQLILSQDLYELLSGCWSPNSVYVRTIKIRRKHEVRDYHFVTLDHSDDGLVDIKARTFRDWSLGPPSVEAENPFDTVEEVPEGGTLDLKELALLDIEDSKHLLHITVFNILLVSDTLAESIVEKGMTGITLYRQIDQKILMPKWGGEHHPNLYYRA